MTILTDRGQEPRKSAWIPWVFVGAMGIVLAVNAVMVTVAVKTFTGLTVEKPYERGIAYNRVLDAQQRQDALGWQVAADMDVAADGLTGRLLLTVRDAGGGAVDALAVEARLVRPVEVIDDVPLFFTPAGDGRYVATVTLPRPGQWDLKARLTGAGADYTLIERLVVR
ncbi:MAG: putative nitrogen fixation protein fixH [Pseudomonadota bacterium]|jgi:nitrogen fixation protein FixH